MAATPLNLVGSTMRSRVTVPLAISLTAILAACAEPPPATPDDGVWQGEVPYEWREIRFELTLVDLGTEQPSGSIDVPDLGALGVPVNVTKTADGYQISTPVGATLDATLSATTGELTGHYTGPGTDRTPVTLVRDNAAFQQYAVPKLGADGSPVTAYQYAMPTNRDDGWQTGDLASAGIDEDGLTTFIDDVLAGNRGRLESMLIVRDGVLVLDEYFYGFTADRPHSIQSVTKSVTSLLMGVAIDQGAIDGIDQPVYEFFPEYAGKPWIDQRYPITLRHALTMSAAIDWNESVPYSDPSNSNTAMNATSDWIGYVLDRDQAGQPGEAASYTSGLSILIGGIIKNATGQYVDEFARDTLFKDLSFSNFHWLGAADGTRHTGGGLLVTARDLAKLGQLVLDDGAWRGEQIVSAAWIDESTARQLPLADALDDDSQGYGYQWWHATFAGPNDQSVRAIAGIGYGGQYLLILPTLDAVVVFNAGEYADRGNRYFDLGEAMTGSVLPALMTRP